MLFIYENNLKLGLIEIISFKKKRMLEGVPSSKQILCFDKNWYSKFEAFLILKVQVAEKHVM